MLTEKEKAIAGQLYNAADPILIKERDDAHLICYQYNSSSSDRLNQQEILNKLLGKVGSNCSIEAPFFCDYGYNIFLGDDVYFNFNCTILDAAPVYIGNGVKLAPEVQLYTAGHPIDPSNRASCLEFASSIRIEDNVWVGGGSILLPGVSVGINTVIGAGSVVTKSLPSNVVAVGNPCRVIKQISLNNENPTNSSS